MTEVGLLFCPSVYFHALTWALFLGFESCLTNQTTPLYKQMLKHKFKCLKALINKNAMHISAVAD